jgi:hypothetical protein
VHIEWYNSSICPHTQLQSRLDFVTEVLRVFTSPDDWSRDTANKGRVKRTGYKESNYRMVSTDELGVTWKENSRGLL